MATLFHVKQRCMYEETIAVEATTVNEAREKLARWEDCDTIASDPCAEPVVVAVDEVK